MTPCRTYINPITKKFGYIQYKEGRYIAIFDQQTNPHMDYDAAFAELVEAGYKPLGIIDETGARRYTMTIPELDELYKMYERFVADCPRSEYENYKDAINAIYTLIHQHILNVRCGE